tara:strand:+ start:239 stop:427 length:189 start_codon:yes stop_codon:yes gene_type:complete
MLEALKTLFENDVVSEEVRADIEGAWEQKIQENKMQATAELRENLLKSTSTISQLWLKLSTL